MFKGQILTIKLFACGSETFVNITTFLSNPLGTLFNRVSVNAA